MGIFNWFKKKETRELLPREQGLRGSWISDLNLSGVAVTESSAMGLSAVHCACNVISQAVGMCKLHVFERTEQGRERADNHYLYPILHDEFNPETTSQIALETLQFHALLWGNGYAELQRDNSGRVAAIFPIHPSIVSPFRDATGTLAYEIQTDAGKVVLAREDVLHVPGLSPDGTIGYRLVKVAREALAYVLATETYGQSYWRNSARPGAIISTTGQLSDNARDNLRKSWNDLHSGSANAGKPAILEEGLTYQPVPGNLESNQYQSIRTFNIQEVARLFNLSPVFLHNLESATWGNLSVLIGQFYTQTLSPWLAKWSNEINRKAFLPNEKNKFYCEFNIDSLYSGDIEARNKGFIEGLSNGWLSHNDVLKKLNMPTIEAGDQHFRPSNLIPIQEPAPIDNSNEDIGNTPAIIDSGTTDSKPPEQQGSIDGNSSQIQQQE